MYPFTLPQSRASSPLLALLILLTACAGTGSRHSNAGNLSGTPLGIEAYWDAYDFTDTMRLAHPEQAEQTFVDFLATLPRQPYEDACTGLRILVEKSRVDSTVHAWFLEKLEHYLYDPNSPYHNGEYYIPVLEAVATGRQEDKTVQARALFRLEMLRKNRPGMIAGNIHFQLPDQRESTLYDVDSPYTLVLFYDPDCETCHQTLEELGYSELLRTATQNDNRHKARLKVVSLCVQGTKNAWRKTLGILPENWINGYDATETVLKNKLYDLRAFPSLYLLGNDKTVILKDDSPENVLNYLYNNINVNI